MLLTSIRYGVTLLPACLAGNSGVASTIEENDGSRKINVPSLVHVYDVSCTVPLVLL